MSTAIPAPAVDERLTGARTLKRLRELAGNVASLAVAVVAPHKASLKRLGDIPLTVTGTGLMDFAAFHLGHGWGFLATGASLWVIEHMIADPDPVASGGEP